MIKSPSLGRYYSTLVDKEFSTYEAARDAEFQLYAKVIPIANDIQTIMKNYDELVTQFRAAEGSTMKISEAASYERKFDGMIKALYESGICNLNAEIIEACAINISKDDEETVTTEHTPKRTVVTVHRVKSSRHKKSGVLRKNNRAECEGCPLQERCRDCN